jgi:predicted metal-dependent hydrolase
MQRLRSIERDSVELALDDGRTVPVARVRDPRARRLKLSVDERGARLTLPPRASLVAGERFLAEHREWVAAQLAHYAADAAAALLPGVTASLPLRAQPVSLRWQEGRYARLQQDADGLVFTLPAKAGAASLRRALRDFYEGEARADLGRWLPRYLPSLPRPPRRVLLKVMSRSGARCRRTTASRWTWRWCSRGRPRSSTCWCTSSATCCGRTTRARSGARSRRASRTGATSATGSMRTAGAPRRPCARCWPERRRRRTERRFVGQPRACPAAARPCVCCRV